MDKLQPLIKHRYWICFVLSVIFVLVGWWTASGTLAKEISDRSGIVTNYFSKAKQGVNEANQFWVEEAKKKNELDEASYKSASAQLLQRQKNARQWPVVLREQMKDIPYRADIKRVETRGRWASIYRSEIERLLSIVRPFKDGKGLVVVETKNLSHKPFNSWRTTYPSSTEIWNLQEDIWLMQSLLTSIARVNEGATRITESQVRQIFKLHLRGGDRNASSGSGGGGGMSGMGGMGGFGSMSSGMAGGMGLGQGGAGGGAAAAGYPGREFEGNAGNDILAEEFGAFARAGGGGMAGAMGGGMNAGGSGFGMSSDMMMGGLSGSGGGGGASQKSAEEKRYVDEGDDLGYKTRAFLLDVLIRDDQVANLLASLTNSDFPVEIVRVEIRSRHTPGGAGPGGQGGLTMGGAGMGGPDMAGMMSSGGMEGGLMAGGTFGGDMDASAMTSGYPGGMDSDAIGSEVGVDSGYGEAGDIYAGGLPPGPGGLMQGGLMSGSGMTGMTGFAAPKGREALKAMADPLLVYVKIGGLMTLYQSAQEADSEAATTEQDQTATPVTTPPGQEIEEVVLPSEDMTDLDSSSDALAEESGVAAGDSLNPIDPASPATTPSDPANPATPSADEAPAGDNNSTTPESPDSSEGTSQSNSDSSDEVLSKPPSGDAG